MNEWWEYMFENLCAKMIGGASVGAGLKPAPTGHARNKTIAKNLVKV